MKNALKLPYASSLCPTDTILPSFYRNFLMLSISFTVRTTIFS